MPARRRWKEGRSHDYCYAICTPRPRLRWSLLALDLSAVHDAARIRVERIASVHGAAIIPHDEIADAPDVLPCKFRSINETPKLVE